MKVILEKMEGSEARLDVELDWTEVQKASEKAYRKLVQQYNIPGFRRGKAPRQILERFIGKDTLYQEGLEDLVNAGLTQGVIEHNLVPLAKASIDAPPLEMGQPYKFKATVPVIPTAELGDYSHLQVEVEQPVIEESDLDSALTAMQNQQASWVPMERPAALGDKVALDIKAVLGDQEVTNGENEELELVAHRPGIFHGLDEELVGMEAGKEKSFTLSTPEDLSDPQSAGKEIHYTVKVNSVLQKEIPPLDDELAKSSGKYENLAELKESIKQRLLANKRVTLRREFTDKAVDALLSVAKVDVHPVLVEQEIEDMVQEMKEMLRQQRIDLKQYLQFTQQDEGTYRQTLIPDAEKRVKTELVLAEFAKRENIEIQEQDLREWLEVYSRISQQQLPPLEQLPQDVRLRVTARVRKEKALAHVVEMLGGNALNDANTTEYVGAPEKESGSREEVTGPAPAADE